MDLAASYRVWKILKKPQMVVTGELEKTSVDALERGKFLWRYICRRVSIYLTTSLHYIRGELTVKDLIDKLGWQSIHFECRVWLTSTTWER
jgi:hypothetical protein